MKIFESFVNQYRERALGNARPVFDGRKNMLAHKLLPFGDAATFNVTLEERTPVASRRPPREFRIRIRRVGDIVMGELFQFLRARSRMTNNCQTAIMALDAIIGHKVSTLHVAVGLRRNSGSTTYEETGWKTDYRNDEYMQQFGVRVSNEMAMVDANTCQDTGMNIPNKNPPILHANPQGNIEESLKQAWPTILMGADVTHPAPGPGSDERPSIAAVTASVDAKASRYAASIRIQRGRTEIIADLANMVKELLKAFYQTCGRKPERILFYRDGISESQFGSIITTEIAAIKAACQALDANYKPTITFVVVQKRHHTRFFPIDRRDADRTGNCPPGTVIETVITHPFEFDFYLQSHAGLLGTSRPAHYYVLYDDNGFNPDMLQTLSYNLCYIYARCTRSVSLVPPVYYAHLVTNRAKLHARGGPFSDTGSEEGGGAAVTFGVVKPELQRVMYFA
ncbi:unnamed protein product [Rhizophagus irregularis]|nr:unnamed protein product [Rhizophagus irregularis]